MSTVRYLQRRSKTLQGSEGTRKGFCNLISQPLSHCDPSIQCYKKTMTWLRTLPTESVCFLLGYQEKLCCCWTEGMRVVKSQISLSRIQNLKALCHSVQKRKKESVILTYIKYYRVSSINNKDRTLILLTQQMLYWKCLVYLQFLFQFYFAPLQDRSLLQSKLSEHTHMYFGGYLIKKKWA